MKSSKNPHFFAPFLTFISAFLAICVLFISTSVAFCKEEPFNTASTSLSSSSPTVIIDAGHGGEDGGTIGKNGIFEKDLNLEIAFILRDMFLAGGYEIVMTRTEDILLYDRNVDFKGRKKALDLLARVKIAQKYENAVFISIHMNAFPDSKYSGLQVYYSTNNKSSLSLATEIQEIVHASLQPDNNRKIKPADSSIYVLDRINLPSVLIECGFLSNDRECALLSSEEYQKKLSLAIFLAVSKYIEMPT